MSKYILQLIIFLYFLAICFKSCNSECDSDYENVGTTLFSESDVYKQCWSSENIAILTTRMILEDLLPSVSVLTMDSDEFVNDIIQYFRLILDIVRNETFGKTKHITLIALTDLLGGYLNRAVLPLARFAYYAGVINYESIIKLIQLFEELKWFLRSNGQGWAKPIAQNPFDCHSIEPFPPLRKVCKSSLHPCNGLTFYKPPHKCAGSKTISLIIPLPFLDVKHRPTSIAVPFKMHPMRNIESRCSAYVVMKYFIAGIKCLQAKKANDFTVSTFRNNLYTWIMNDVIPLLNDEKFYSAFGGVLRVVETLRKQGAKEVDLNKVVGIINKFSRGENNTDVADITANAPVSYHRTMSKNTMILIGLLLCIVLWFCIGTLFICYRLKKNKSCKTCDHSGETSRDGEAEVYGDPEGDADIDEERASPSKTGTTTPTSVGSKVVYDAITDTDKSWTSQKYTSSKVDTDVHRVETIDSDKSRSSNPWADQSSNYCECRPISTEYAKNAKSPESAYIFGYDEFETSSDETTSRGSEDASDLKTK